MRVLVLVKESPEAEAGQLPPDEVFIEMNKFNESLVDAGVMLAADGLAPSSKGNIWRSREPTISRRSVCLAPRAAIHQYAAHISHIAGKRNR